MTLSDRDVAAALDALPAMSPEAETILRGRLQQLADEPSEATLAPFRCSRCGYEAVPPGRPEETILRCGECGTFQAYGVELARVTNQPHPEDRRFVTARFEHAGAGLDMTISLEREYARGVALDMLSVADPVVFAAFQTIAAAMVGDRNSSSAPPGDDAVATLDEPNLPAAT